MADLSDSRLAPRRGFLRGLLTLPLIGGGVTLLGQPTRAAVPITAELLQTYHAFLSREARATLAEIEATRWPDRVRDFKSFEAYCDLLRDDCGVDRVLRGGDPSSRAAVVLAAAGVAQGA